MSDFNERFTNSTRDFPYIRFLSAKVDADNLKVTVKGVYRKEFENQFLKDRQRITAELKKLLPPSARVELSASAMSYTSSEIVRSVLDYLSRESVFVYSSVTKDDVSVTTGNNPTLTLIVDEAVGDYIENNGIKDKLQTYLELCTFEKFTVKIEKRADDIEQIKSVLTAVTHKPRFSYERPEEGRTINPGGRTQMHGDVITENAQYICDCIQPGFVVLYGTMTDVKEHEYTPKKAENDEKRKFKTFFLDDTTGKMRCVFFPGPKSEGLLKYIQDGYNIIASGKLDYDTRLNDGSMQFSVRRFTGCDRAEFEINQVVRLVDDEYRYVMPEKYTYHTQSALYGENKAPLTDEPIVIFDTLTTSVNPSAFGELIEIGAVKIADGRIIETFNSFVRPMGTVSDELRQSLGLISSDLAGKPTFDQVIPDFYKFFDGYSVSAFPYDFNIKVLEFYLEKLHIQMPTTVDLTKYADKTVLKNARPKNTRRTLPAAEAIAKILTNS